MALFLFVIFVTFGLIQLFILRRYSLDDARTTVNTAVFEVQEETRSK